MAKFKVVMIGKMNGTLLERLHEQCELIIWDKSDPIPREILLEWVKDADGLISRGDIKINDELLSNAPKLRVIAQPSAGFDNVSIDACTRRSIPFGNTPRVLVEATADLTFGLLLTSARRIHEGWEFVQAGEWKTGTNIPLAIDLYGKKLGIVGMGNIGRAVAKRAQASGMNIIYHNRNPREENEQLGASYVSFQTLLEESDFVVVLVPLSEQSKGLFGREEFSKMKPTSYFINASRGAIVDTDALYEALLNKEIAYAALDVTDPEPLSIDHPIMSLKNILITPHIGSATTETRMAMASLTVDNIVAGLNKKKLPSCVNESVNYP
ncbi:2-hydroxyacid dehydrogenase [Oceanobacillus sp. CAU 1775]